MEKYKITQTLLLNGEGCILFLNFAPQKKSTVDRSPLTVVLNLSS